MIRYGHASMRIPVTAFLLVLATAATAETRYVSDELVITLRTGKANTYQILRTLHSGTSLEVLEQSDKYARVRTTDGLEGWVLAQYLTDTPIARERLKQAQQRLDKLQADNRQLQQSLSAVRQEKKTLQREQNALRGESEKLNKELAQLREVAARPIELDRQNSALNQRIQAMQRESDQLKADNQRLADRSQREWFLTGAGVLFGGILLGILLPLLRRKKRTGMFD
jgi:SH3 domain protein